MSSKHRRFPLAALAFLAAFAACGGGDGQADRPWESLPTPSSHTDHTSLIDGPFGDGPSVTRRCLACHEDEAQEVMATSHWSWLGGEVEAAGRDKPVRIGKANVINNFCIAVVPNTPRCTSCHAGYGWEDETFDFTDAEKVDCLICHDTTGAYRKGLSGRVADGVDLLTVAQSVGPPTRMNCGRCHFAGGGGDAVKHGDMDGSMYFPSERIDVHMGRHGFQCQTCHRTTDHVIPGCAMSVCVDREARVTCRDCHSEAPHRQDRLNSHVETVACQTCHIPRMAVHWATKMSWDWSEAGQDLPINDPQVYLKKKGRFLYARGAEPEYAWYNGLTDRYLVGDTIEAAGTTSLNSPVGHIGDPVALIWPFKVHRAKQPYDKLHRYLLTPRTYGPGGYWTEFDWDKANSIGMEKMGLPYSGQYGFAETSMYWPLNHMVQTKDKALQCRDCHTETGRMNWQALGYGEDPAFLGGRRQLGLLAEEATP